MGLVDDQVAVVIGGTSGIGARTAELLDPEGPHVVIAGRRRATGEVLAGRLAGEAVHSATRASVRRGRRKS
jgi:NADP-dependent 3-hydroxy acid dehydrogenase YdfG